MKDLSIT